MLLYVVMFLFQISSIRKVSFDSWVDECVRGNNSTRWPHLYPGYFGFSFVQWEELERHSSLFLSAAQTDIILQTHEVRAHRCGGSTKAI